ncbi:MAG: cytochrome d ubiquinol oxidase subunit II [Bacteroidetes bacterium]|uniref:Cytochrome d ubiquinol oxidase subunit II n=1 Tax=Candidatus Cryptobacteroides merdigallinarum TaxID=2840770 RepID=A0A9D9EMS1_9BACT|nr:cytochrome d ubiquinol oxidase subunit II [Candidatus Cryptobacteroides merdigallinarum]
MFEYSFLQHYWWFLISLLGGLLVFLMFVQGGNAMIFLAGKNEGQRQLIVNSTGRKWEFTFTTLVTFGGAFFASFPLFYSTSFGGAFWVWVLILITFVLQAVSYEFQTKAGNILGPTAFRVFLTVNGCLAPLLIGTAVGTFFTGSDFTVDKGAVGDSLAPVISVWGNGWHGLEAVADVRNVLLGLAVMFLSAVSGCLYMLGNIEDEGLSANIRKHLPWLSACFVASFVAFVVSIFLSTGYAVESDGTVVLEKYKYWHNFTGMPAVAVIFLAGVLSVLYGIGRTCLQAGYRRGIWWTGAGAVLAVMAVLMLAGYNGTAYYPSSADLQSSLTIENSSSSEFTLKVMTYVSFIIPFVLAYIVYAWRSMDRKPITSVELETTSDKY